MKQIWYDKRLFLTSLGLILCVTSPASATIIATICGFYLANRAYVDGKLSTPTQKEPQP